MTDSRRKRRTRKRSPGVWWALYPSFSAQKMLPAASGEHIVKPPEDAEGVVERAGSRRSKKISWGDCPGKTTSGASSEAEHFCAAIRPLFPYDLTASAAAACQRILSLGRQCQIIGWELGSGVLLPHTRRTSCNVAQSGYHCSRGMSWLECE